MNKKIVKDAKSYTHPEKPLYLKEAYGISYSVKHPSKKKSAKRGK